MRLSDPGSLYYDFTAEFDSVSFVSEYLGYDKDGNEVRVPRLVTGDLKALQMLRSVGPLYVIANASELITWRWFWRGPAYLPGELAKAYFPTCFNREHHVVERPCLELVRAKHRLNDPLRKILGKATSGRTGPAKGLR